MAEKCSKSKLKRNKSTVRDVQPVTVKRSHTASSSSEITAETGRSAVPAAVWWNSEQLPAVESLWALTLKSALPYLENQHWDLVPDLPHPSTARPTALTLDEQRWFDLGEEVTPFPEPCPPSPRTSSCPDPLGLGSSRRELSVQTEPAPDPSDRQLSSHSRQSHDGNTTSLQALTKRPRSSPHSWEGPTSSAGPSSAGGDEGRKRGTGLLNRQFLTNQGKVSESRVSLQREGENEAEVVEDKDEEEVQRSVRGDGGAAAAAAGGARLQICPMCLLVFPVGFTQMDCDGHLAQCLSEVNVDMTW
ncbi:uncharacterized protein LOC141772301 [Sebastes fasciatus]|uniref:uncharacterized protein LOC141772301 n=1 Tax=Sebastes fasciatus TaxID=394691 RepID=UPI003D9F342C